MEVQRQQHGAVCILRPKGALTGADADAFKAEFLTASARALGRVAVDLSEVPFSDSRGLEVLAELSAELEGSGRSLRLCALPDTLREVLALTGLTSSFEHYQDAAAAARSFL